MTEYVDFTNFVTKGIEIEKSDRRIFKGHITAEIIDRQQEFVFVKEVMAIMKNFMEVNPVISDFHSNRMVGRVLDYEKSEYEGVPTVKITGEVYKKDGVTLYDKIWDKVIKGEYAGLSMGGASKEREPIMKDGKMALELRKLELYEIALCETPANPFAIIEEVNIFAKSFGKEEMVKEDNGRQYIQCTSIGCRFEKGGTNMDNDNDIDNKPVHEYICLGKGVCDICGKKEEEHGLEQFDKPELEKGIGNAKSLVGRSAETRSESIGESATSPKQVVDMINNISSSKVHKDYGSQNVVPGDSGGASKDVETQKDILDKKIENRDIPKSGADLGFGKAGEKIESQFTDFTQPNKVQPPKEPKPVESKLAEFEPEKVEKDHIPSTAESIEELARKKIAGEQAGSRTISVDKTHALPTANGTISESDGGHSDYTAKQSSPELKGSIGETQYEDQTNKHPETTNVSVKREASEGIHDESRNPAEHQKQALPESNAEDKPKQWKENINAYVKHFGRDQVRKALEEADTYEHILEMLNKYKSS